MERRPIKNRKSKPRNARPYDRPNQGIVSKVASKIKGLLNPSWIFNVSQWMSTPSGDDSNPAVESVDEESAEEEEEPLPPPPTHGGSKRPRLTLNDHTPSTSNTNQGTRTWLDSPSTSHVFNEPSVGIHRIFGDDHSENSEASTSGCSSLVSSHKGQIGHSALRLSENSLSNIRRELKSFTENRNCRNDITSPKDVSSPSASSTKRAAPWSTLSPVAKFQKRTPSVINSTQPNFNVSALAGLSKLNQSQTETSPSPFYPGRTSFGGASAIRKIPVRASPYSVEKTPRNQLKVRVNKPEDNLEGMSSTAKRILGMLEKMSSPVADAKKMPNTNRSPVDLSLYMMPPKHRSNITSTRPINKGPPIANISAISRLTTLKSSESRRFQNNPVPLESLSLPSVPLPVTSLPSFNFGPSTSRNAAYSSKAGQDFVFSNPIDMMPSSNLPPLHSNFSSNPPVPGWECSNCTNINRHDKQKCTICETHRTMRSIPNNFNFPVPTSSPFGSVSHVPAADKRIAFRENLTNLADSISADILSSQTLSPYATSSSNSPLCRDKNANISFNLPAATASQSTWVCDGCWVHNSSDKLKCPACETPNPSNCVARDKQKEASSDRIATTASFPIPTSSFLSGNRQVDTSTAAKKSTPATSGSQNWECQSCWVKNSSDKFTCVACETPRDSEGGKATGFSFQATSTPASFGGFSIPATESSSPQKTDKLSTVGGETCKTPGFSFQATGTAASFGGHTIPTTKSSNSEKQDKNPAASEKTGKVSSQASDWVCDTCLVKNSSDKSKCCACETMRLTKDKLNFSKPPLPTSPFGFKVPDSLKNNSMITSTVSKEKSSTTATSSLGFGESWECASCLVKNGADKLKCAACGTDKKGKDIAPAVSSSLGSNPMINSPSTVASIFGGNKSTPKTSETAAKDVPTGKVAEPQSGTGFNLKTTTPLSTANVFSATPATKDLKVSSSSSSPFTTSVPSFKFGDQTDAHKTKANQANSNWECTMCMVKNNSDNLTCASCAAPKPSIDRTKVSPKTETLIVGTEVKVSSTISSSQSTIVSSSSLPGLFTQPVTNKDANQTSKPATDASEFKFGATSTETKSPKLLVENQWKCSSCLAKNNSDQLKCSGCNAAKVETSAAGGFNFKMPSTLSTNMPGACMKTSNVTEDKKPAAPFIFGATASTQASSFSLPTSSATSSPALPLPTSSAPASQGSLAGAASMFNIGAQASSVPMFGDKHATSDSPLSKVSSAPSQASAFALPTTSAPAFKFGGKTTTSDSPFSKVSTAPSSQASPFTLPTSSAPVFKFGEKAATSDSPFSKASSAPSSQASQFTLPTSSAPLFKFGDKTASSDSPFSKSVVPQSTPSTAVQPVFKFGTSATASLPTSSSTFDVKTVSKVTPSSNAAASNTFTFGNPTPAAAQSGQSSGFSFFPTTAPANAPASSAPFVFGSSSSTQAVAPGGFTFKGTPADKTSTVTPGFGLSTTTSAPSSVFKFGSSAPAPSGGFAFNAVKSEPASTTSTTFTFGSGASATGNTSAFSGFQANTAPAPAFQFGAQPSTNQAAPSAFGASNSQPSPFGGQLSSNQPSAFGGQLSSNQPTSSAFGGQFSSNQIAAPSFGGAATGGFMFGSKTSSGNQLTNSTPQAPAFGSAQSVFGAAAAPAFGNADKPAFNFGAAASSTPSFQFGSVEKKQATASQMQFGTPQAAVSAQSFNPQFSVNTPPSFNFGASASTPTGPFQFAASGDQVSQPSGPRKIRKALRRVRNE